MVSVYFDVLLIFSCWHQCLEIARETEKSWTPHEDMIYTEDTVEDQDTQKPTLTDPGRGLDIS